MGPEPISEVVDSWSDLSACRPEKPENRTRDNCNPTNCVEDPYVEERAKHYQDQSADDHVNSLSRCGGQSGLPDRRKEQTTQAKAR